MGEDKARYMISLSDISVDAFKSIYHSCENNFDSNSVLLSKYQKPSLNMVKPKGSWNLLLKRPVDSLVTSCRSAI